MKRQERGICPKCQGNALEYIEQNQDYDWLEWRYTCNKCDYEGKEVYIVNFVKHVDDK